MRVFSLSLQRQSHEDGQAVHEADERLIQILLGNIGSGKSAVCVREILNHPENTYISNIKTPKLKNNIMLDRSMIVKEIPTGRISKGQEVMKYTVNREYWEEIKKKHPAIHVIIDEAHTIMNSRRSMSKLNIVVSEWLALLRRVVGQDSNGQGSLTLISQLDYRVDIIARDMATNVRYHVCHYQKTCLKCGVTWQENNEMPEPQYVCPRCGSHKVKRHTFVIEKWSFQGMNQFMMFKYRGQKTYYEHFLIHDIEQSFPMYDTLQWDNLISEV